MTAPKSSQAVHTPDRLLSDISNRATVSRASSCVNRKNIPVRGSACLLDTRNDKRENLSKAHGDLSNIRPKSPPRYSLSAALGKVQIDSRPTHGFGLPHDCYVDDSHSVCSERDHRGPLGGSRAQNAPAFRSSLAAQSKRWSTSELRFEPTKQTSRQYARTPRYSLESPFIPPRLRKRRAHTLEILTDTPRFDINGLSLGYASASDLYGPVIRDYRAEDGRDAGSATTIDYLKLRPPVEHIDVCTTWKGLSLTEAELWLRLNRIFKTCLENLIADQLGEQDQEFRPQQSRSPPDVVESSAPLTFCCRSVFSRTELRDSMIRLLESSQDYYILGFQTNDLKRLLRFFLASCDCLVDIERTGFQNTAIDLRFQYSQTLVPEGPTKLAVEAGWNPDFLTFEQLTIFPREGHELRIIPRYNSNAVFRIDGQHTDLRYSLETPLPWLTWDDQMQGFKGVVPMYSEIRGIDSKFGKVYRPGRVGPHAVVNQLRIELKAMFTECCPPSLRLERTVRTRLTLKVLPWYALDSVVAPDNESVGPIMPGTARHYVDELFLRGISEQTDPRRIPAAQLQVRCVTGLSSLLDGDGLLSVELNSSTSSDRSFTRRFESAGSSTLGLQTRGKEAISAEATNQSSLEKWNDTETSTEGSQKAGERPRPIRSPTGCWDQSLTSVSGNLTSSTLNLRYEEDATVSSETSARSLPTIFYNRYSALRGLKEKIDISSDGSDDESGVSSSQSATSPSERRLLYVCVEKGIQRRSRAEKNTESGLSTWPEDIFSGSGGVAVSFDDVDLL